MFEVVQKQLRRANALILSLAAAQTVFALVALASLVLADGDGGWGWARALGLVSAALGAFEGVVLITSRSRGSRGVASDLIISVTCIIMSVGIVGLVCDTPNRPHAEDGSTDAAERGLCFLIVAWGVFLVRIGADVVEREASVECAYECHFDP